MILNCKDSDKNGDFSILMRTQALRTSWKQARSKLISAENETAVPPGQEVFGGRFPRKQIMSQKGLCA